MRCFLTRDESGSFSLAKVRPTPALIMGTEIRAWYFAVGEPIGWRNMCAAVVTALLGRDPGMAPMGEPQPIEAFLIYTKDMTVELRHAIKAAQSGETKVQPINHLTEGDTTMADQVRPPYTPPPDDTRIPSPTLKDEFTTKLRTYVNGSQILAGLSQANRDKLIVDIVAIAFPTTTSTQTR